MLTDAWNDDQGEEEAYKQDGFSRPMMQNSQTKLTTATEAAAKVAEAPDPASVLTAVSAPALQKASAFSPPLMLGFAPIYSCLASSPSSRPFSRPRVGMAPAVRLPEAQFTHLPRCPPSGRIPSSCALAQCLAPRLSLSPQDPRIAYPSPASRKRGFRIRRRGCCSMVFRPQTRAAAMRVFLLRITTRQWFRSPCRARFPPGRSPPHRLSRTWSFNMLDAPLIPSGMTSRNSGVLSTRGRRVPLSRPCSPWTFAFSTPRVAPIGGALTVNTRSTPSHRPCPRPLPRLIRCSA